MLKKYCETCKKHEDVPELNDDDQIQPKIDRDEIVMIANHGSAHFKVTKIDGMVLTLEKV